MSERTFVGRSLARSQALQLLFQAELRGLSVAEVLNGPYALSQSDPLDEYGEQLARGTDERRHELDCVISEASTNWTVDRMPSVDRNLLRLALYEMIFEDEVDVAISIDESVELAKAYGTDASPSFVNGVLGRVASDIASGEDVIEVAVRRVREKAEAKAAAEREAAERAEAEAAAKAAAEQAEMTHDQSDAPVHDAEEAPVESDDAHVDDAERMVDVTSADNAEPAGDVDPITIEE